MAAKPKIHRAPSFLEAWDKLFAPTFRPADNLDGLRLIGQAVFEPASITPKQMPLFKQIFGSRRPPSAPVNEAWLLNGRQIGKSRLAAIFAVYVAAFRDHRRLLTPGQRGKVLLLASSKSQARTLMDYVSGLFELPELAPLVVSRTTETIALSTRVDLEIMTADFRRVRGYTTVAAIADEICFWFLDADNVNRDVEVLRALRPAMARIPNRLLICLSSPFAKKGAAWDAFREFYGQDAPVLVSNAPTKLLNPHIDPAVIADAYRSDPSWAAAEYGAQWRDDLESYVRSEVLDAATLKGVTVLPTERGKHYMAFADAASGSGSDSFALAVACVETGTLVYAKEWKPPFSPAAIVAEGAQTLREYRCPFVTGDRWSKGLLAEAWQREGIRYRESEHDASTLYLVTLMLLNSGKVRLLEQPVLLRQLSALIRTPSKITHAGGHDDLANAAAGALVLAAEHAPRLEAQGQRALDIEDLDPNGVLIHGRYVVGAADDMDDERRARYRRARHAGSAQSRSPHPRTRH